MDAIGTNRLIWGRWARDTMVGDGLTIPFLEAMKGRDVTVGDGYYFLFREPPVVNALPSLTTKVDFGLKASSVYYRAVLRTTSRRPPCSPVRWVWISPAAPTTPT